ncbi:ABC transporter ATP-binding protein [uncultured Imperialibacter sp.]|uniref:ABC transporter ATP-binding protein n=1 Tax=uncultured Imperialibacter sp. TaxID=1672639 RepID=UPI0030DD48E8|tara:strand:- start:17295 stop:18530 length:1236 start_codon:yes stop_codon:yes gene_type:complete
MSRAIEVEGISKKYELGHQKAGSLSESLKSKFGRRYSKEEREFWALKDVSFQVNEGEAVGIIGRNGAGKSTLLKILSRITYPTSGNIKLFGRVSALLEVGTGFHPELSGRENIYLNGTILGMRRSEVKAKFDEIVEFSGVSKFLDTPIKHYSSGMKVRLAFAVAAHLEPEILIIDEVLAVGDAEFQKKCLGKMEEVAGQGRTVLFVSHNIEAISLFCRKGILLNKGVIELNDTIEKVVSKYLEHGVVLGERPIHLREDRDGLGNVQLIGIDVLKNDKKCTVIRVGENIKFRFLLKKDTSSEMSIRLDVGLNTATGKRISWFSTSLFNRDLVLVNQIETVDLQISRFPFNVGSYSLTIFITQKEIVEDWVKEAIFFNVESGDFFSQGRSLPENQGAFLVEHSFLNSPYENNY